MKRLFIVFFVISAGLFGEETGLQAGNAGEGGGTFTFYDDKKHRFFVKNIVSDLDKRQKMRIIEYRMN